MNYKGYKIIAHVNVNQVWEFEERDGEICLNWLVSEDDADESTIKNFTIEDKDGDQIDEYPETLDAAKAIIDTLPEAA